MTVQGDSLRAVKATYHAGKMRSGLGPIDVFDSSRYEKPLRQQKNVSGRLVGQQEQSAESIYKIVIQQT